MCLWFYPQICCATFIIFRRIQGDGIMDVHWSSCKVRVIVNQVLQTLEFFFRQIFRKIIKNKISWKSDPWEPSLSMRTDVQTTMTKLIVAFCRLANAPKHFLFCPLIVFLRFLSILQQTAAVPVRHWLISLCAMCVVTCFWCTNEEG